MTGSSARRTTLEPYEPFFGRLPEAVLADLEAFGESVEKWQGMQNLVSRETVSVLWERHILDSLQLLPLMDAHLRAHAPANLLDIGSGGGFPALPLAIALKDRPVHLHLIESRARKCAFLRAVIRDFDLPATVHTVRIEEAEKPKIGPVHAVTARALAGLPVLFGYIAPFWQEGTRGFLHKGREYGEELRQADSVWRSDVVKHPGKVDPQGVILEISALERIT
ncbi:16S rRNA (guanine(527)-N(7))-methyltransferase RsmG [Pelagibacterium sediminicola]|uniref:16S rRNA (guanine(527)-N(7))-methyltransferase RsmG n=1 Tax=Pelagibacterium sediminicola TaxID=2248761 RepID=UPI000E31EC18|nr:16S rRNA (guanine(527)-N(7))-methyltransferase RsmG [Pelagibacterium sediminicola]